MGRLVYVREDREAEPRFTGPPAGGRGGYEGGPGRGGFGGGFGGGMGGGGGGRQIYVSNVCYIPPFAVSSQWAYIDVFFSCLTR